MQKRIFVFFTICLNLLTACEQADMTTLFNPDDVTFYATNGDLAATKTILQAEGTIQWLPKEEINIFYGNNGSAKFVSDNTEQAGTVAFKGTLTDFSYREGTVFWAVYPYRETHVFIGDAVTVSLPSQQTAIAESFADDLFVSIARTTDFTLQFYNVCGGIKFCVTEAGVKTVSFQGNGNEPVAGSAKVGFNSDGKPEIIEVTEPVTTITLTPPDGSCFKEGAWYYIAVWPTALKNGYKIVLTKEDGTSTVKRNGSPVTVKRAIWGVLENLDTGLVYKHHVPDNEIWYTTTDGQVIESTFLSDVLSNVYENGKGRMVFRESLTTIPMYCFSGQTRLETMSLPESVTTIGTIAFAQCENLASIDMPGVVTIGPDAFEFSGLTGTLILPDSLEDIDQFAFSYCSKLDIIIIPEKVKRIGEGAFLEGGYTKVYVKPLVPPVIEGSYYLDMRDGLWERKCLIYVPEESLDAYHTANMWHDMNAYITTEGKMPPECYYTSTDYSRDGEVVFLQKATEGKGIDLVFLGDGFVDRDLEPGGIFEQQILKELEFFFTYEPFKSLKNRFNVIMVKAVSKNDVFFSPFGSERLFTYDVDNYLGDPDPCAEPYGKNFENCEKYAQLAIHNASQPICAAVLLNKRPDREGGVCYFTPRSTEGGRLEDTFAFVSDFQYGGDFEIFTHEFGGHGFGHLADEYIGIGATFPEDGRNDLDLDVKERGFGINIDWRNQAEDVRWSYFLKDPRYTEEGLGVWEGGLVYEFNIYRCSENSVMNRTGGRSSGPKNKSGWFNAPSREQIYKRAMQLSESPDWKYDYETFVEFDAAGREQAAKAYKEWLTASDEYWSSRTQ